MADGETFPNSLPVLYVRGTHYEVGYNVVWSLINHDVLFEY